MKLSLITISALMTATIHSTAQTDSLKPASGETQKTYLDFSEKPARMAREKNKQAEVEKSQKILEESLKKQDTLSDYARHCMTCGMG